MIQRPNKEVILNFYRLMRKYGCNFAELSDSRIAEIDAAVESWRYFFTNKSYNLLSMMTLTAEKMTCSNGVYTAKTPTEKVYFYVKMIDPQFLFLEAQESGNTMEEIKRLCILNFKLYDPTLISFEKELHKVLKDLPEDMWTLDRIKR